MVSSLKDKIAATRSLSEALTIVARHPESSGAIKITAGSVHGTVLFTQGRLLSCAVPKGHRTGRKALDKLLTFTDATLKYRSQADLTVKQDELLDLDINELLSTLPPVTLIELPESVAPTETEVQLQAETGAPLTSQPAGNTSNQKAKPKKTKVPKTSVQDSPLPEVPVPASSIQNIKPEQNQTDGPKTKSQKARTQTKAPAKSKQAGPRKTEVQQREGDSVSPAARPSLDEHPIADVRTIDDELAVADAPSQPNNEALVAALDLNAAAADYRAVAAKEREKLLDRELSEDLKVPERTAALARQIAQTAEQRRLPVHITVPGVLATIALCALCVAIVMVPSAIRRGAHEKSNVDFTLGQLRLLIQDDLAGTTPTAANDVISSDGAAPHATESSGNLTKDHGSASDAHRRRGHRTRRGS